MKKLYTSQCAKLLAALLWTGAIIGTVISVGNMIFTYEQDYDDVLSDGKSNIRHNLAVRAVSMLPDDSDENQRQRDELIEEMEKNMDFALVSGDSIRFEDVDLSDPSVYIYRSSGFDEKHYSNFFEGSSRIRCDEDLGSLIAMAGYVPFYYSDDTYLQEHILRYVLEEGTGILYIRTNQASYPVERFTVCEEDGEEIGENSQWYVLSEDGGYVSNDGKKLKWKGKDIGISLAEGYYTDDPYDDTGYYSGDNSETMGRLYWNGKTGEEKSGYELIHQEKKALSVKEIPFSISTDGQYLWRENDAYTRYWVLMEPKSPEEGSLMGNLETVLSRVYNLKDFYPILTLLGFVIFAASSIFLLCAAGHRKGQQEVSLSVMDRISLEILTAAVVILEAIGAACIMAATENVGMFPLPVVAFLMLFLAALMLLVFLPYALSVTVRLKTHKFMRYTLVYHVWRFVCRVCNGIRRRFQRCIRKIYRTAKERTGLVIKTVLILIALLVVEAISVTFLCVTFYEYSTEAMMVSLALCTAILFLEKGLMLEVVVQLHRLQKGSERIAAGNLTTPIDTRGLFWEFKKHAENINKISDGIQIAVQEQMKSEHFKTELITNVSHDIKTPLTSIINYVDLMKKEEITDPTMQSYVEVLDRQSARLKKLIEDLMEASKASTGSLEVNLEQCDVGVLMTQMVGEYEERAAAESLQFIVNGSESPIMIMADGRHLWRVFDNLLGNACKYAMPGTRIYIDLHMEDIGPGVSVITFKNVSKSQLNISSEELMERFVRGDSSRNTEGSGLGLSIAQSLTELMGGTLVLMVDGDLFKVTLRFPIVK